MQILKIKTSAVLAAIGVGMGLILCFLLLIFSSELEVNLTSFILMINIIIMAGNLFLFHFLVVFAANIETTVNPITQKNILTKKLPKKTVSKTKQVVKKTEKKSVPKKTVKKSTVKKTTKK